jgi:hypothetical protein
MNKTFFVPVLLFAISCGRHSDNLLTNANAEIPRSDTVPAGWDNISGNWISQQGDSSHHDYGYSDSGKYYFFAGYGAIGILQQDTPLMLYEKDIDNGKLKCILTGKERSLDQGPLSDQGLVKLACLDATKRLILYSYSTDTLMSKDKWKAFSDTFPVPKFTRYLRVQLVAIRHVGGDNDGYFDNISLSVHTAPNYLLIILIPVLLVVIVAGVSAYLMRARSSSK